MGPIVRFDDFEVAFASDKISPGRTSNVFAEGMNDSNEEACVIYGTSTGNVLLTPRVTLEDIWESARPQASPSRYPLSNGIVKQSKFTAEFPPVVKAPISTSWSASDNNPLWDSGAQIQVVTTDIPDGSTLCGVLNISGHMLPENVATSTQDNLELVLTIEVSMGSSLLPKRRKSYKRMSYKSKKGGRTYGRRYRRKG
tara:strand:- start:138 stop:731 length:594 start_codon:yes stop_codon:yes gene_type:complete